MLVILKTVDWQWTYSVLETYFRKHKPALLNTLWFEAQTRGYSGAWPKEQCHETAPHGYVSWSFTVVQNLVFNWICSVVECLPRIWYVLFQAQKFDPVRVVDWTILMILTQTKLPKPEFLHSRGPRRPDMPSICTLSSKRNIKFHGEHWLERGGLFIGSKYLVTLALSNFALSLKIQLH